jgi:hypothetical protein
VDDAVQGRRRPASHRHLRGATGQPLRKPGPSIRHRFRKRNIRPCLTRRGQSAALRHRRRQSWVDEAATRDCDDRSDSEKVVAVCADRNFPGDLGTCLMP